MMNSKFIQSVKIPKRAHKPKHTQYESIVLDKKSYILIIHIYSLWESWIVWNGLISFGLIRFGLIICYSYMINQNHKKLSHGLSA